MTREDAAKRINDIARIYERMRELEGSYVTESERQSLQIAVASLLVWDKVINDIAREETALYADEIIRIINKHLKEVEADS